VTCGRGGGGVGVGGGGFKGVGQKDLRSRRGGVLFEKGVRSYAVFFAVFVHFIGILKKFYNTY